jgi:hypothetical protein
MQIKLKDLYFGNIDAKNELRANDPESIARFMEAFIVPQDIDEQSFLKGIRFLIYGPKGTGKTALLRYLGLRAQEEGAEVKFVLFRPQLASQEYDLASMSANTSEIATAGPEPEGQDYEEVWKWLFHRIILDTVKKSNKASPILDDENFQKYEKIVNLAGEGQEGTLLGRLLPRLKKGKIEIGAVGGLPTGSIGLDLEWVSSSKAQVSFRSLLRFTETAFENLRPGLGKLMIMLDELELTLGQKHKYERDVRMIRDVIISASHFNDRCQELRIPIQILVAVRSEVLDSVASSGKEINKIVEDFGCQISWNRTGDDPSHPLLEIIARRINSGERRAGTELSPLHSVWERYFPDYIQEIPVRQYILHQTWYRPRDIVRLFTSICKDFGEDNTFKHTHFDQIKKQYSLRVWIEEVEELRATYSVGEIDAVKKILTGFKPYFLLDDWVARTAELAPVYTNVRELLENKSPADILTDLYRIGIVGNDYLLPGTHSFRQRWSFRGDSDPLLDKRFAIHRGLWSHLSLR